MFGNTDLLILCLKGNRQSVIPNKEKTELYCSLILYTRWSSLLVETKILWRYSFFKERNSLTLCKIGIFLWVSVIVLLGPVKGVMAGGGWRGGGEGETEFSAGNIKYFLYIYLCRIVMAGSAMRICWVLLTAIHLLIDTTHQVIALQSNKCANTVHQLISKHQKQVGINHCCMCKVLFPVLIT